MNEEEDQSVEVDDQYQEQSPPLPPEEEEKANREEELSLQKSEEGEGQVGESAESLTGQGEESPGLQADKAEPPGEEEEKRSEGGVSIQEASESVEQEMPAVQEASPAVEEEQMEQIDEIEEKEVEPLSAFVSEPEAKAEEMQEGGKEEERFPSQSASPDVEKDVARLSIREQERQEAKVSEKPVSFDSKVVLHQPTAKPKSNMERVETETKTRYADETEHESISIQKANGKQRVRVLNSNERQMSHESVRSSARQIPTEVSAERVRTKEAKRAMVPPPRSSSRIPGGGGRDQPQLDNLVAELGSKLARQTAKLEASEKAKEELEDMLLRIEKHFKTEQMLRRKAEVSLDQMRQSLKNSEMDGSRLKSERQALERQKLKNIQERTKLEEERSQMQVLIQTAGEQERKAKIELQELHHSVSTREEMIQYRLQAGYSATIAKLESEIVRLKEELEYRTVSMHSELQKWRDQAQFATNALREAKNEVIDRKRELDTTKERMDLLVEKLYTGRERGMELRGAIDVQIHQSQLAHEMREKFQAQQVQGANMPIEMPYGGAYANEVSLKLPAVDGMPPRVYQGKPSEVKPVINFEQPKPDTKVESGTPRLVQDRQKVAKRGASPSYSRAPPSKVVESRRVARPKNVGYAQIHIRDSKESVKRSRAGGQRTPPASKPSRGGKDRWTESNRESAMAAYAARWE